MRVPPWVVIPATVVTAHCSAHDEHALMELADALHATFGGAALAVRSSAVGEDGESHSFAGQFETVLAVQGVEALVDAIRRCWSSANTTHALDYRRRSGREVGEIAVAVIVQQMIDADAAGVLFTVDPVSGATDRVRVSACHGIGNRLVDGAIDADEIVTTRDGETIQSLIRGDTPAIDPATLRDLVRGGMRIAAAEGPRDIEWAVAGGAIWWLQSRPITSTVRPARTIVWDNSNIQESYCGVTTPLTFSFASMAYAAVYAQTMRAVGLSERIIAGHRDVLGGLLGLINGRVYYNLNNWYRGLLLLPAFRRNKADMERMMGVEEPVDFVHDEAADWPTRVRRMPTLVATALRLAARFVTRERDAVAFLANFDALVARVDRQAVERKPLAELVSLIELLRRDGIERWTTPIINDFYVMMTVGRLRRIVARACGADDDRTLQTLLGGADVAVSSAHAMLMLRMADVAREQRDVCGALTDSAPNGLRRAASLSAEFASLLAELHDRYGDRCMGELKLESCPLREDDDFVIAMLRNYLRARPADAGALAQKARTERAAAEAHVASRLGVLDRLRFRRTVRAARLGIRAREAMRLARTRLFGAHRDLYRAIGTRLHADGHLLDASDIYYLTVEEIARAIAGGERLDWAEIAGARRAVFATFADRTPPNRVITTDIPDPFAPTADMDPAVSSADPRPVLTGLGCSAGVAEGPVRVVTTARDDLSIHGHVLVATRTDPGWSPLFHAAAAIVVERGSILSHSAVLARELGIPAVVGIPGLVATLRDGERVRVDGAAGTVERLAGR